MLTLILIFAFQGNTVLANPLHIVLIAVPLILQTFLIFAIAYLACNWDILTSFEVGMFSVIVHIIQIIGYPLMT